MWPFASRKKPAPPEPSKVDEAVAAMTAQARQLARKVGGEDAEKDLDRAIARMLNGTGRHKTVPK